MDLTLCEKGTVDDLDRDWDAERKLDGIRVYSENGRLFTRQGSEITANFPEVDVPEDDVLDGEIITADFEFRSVLRRKQVGKPHMIEMLADSNPAFFIVFDCLVSGGEDIRDKPLTERREAIDLEGLGAHIVQITSEDDPHDLWEQVVEEDMEGVVLKDPDSSYPGERTDSWLKIKNWKEQTFPILDWEITDDDGFVIRVDIGTDEPQKVVANGQIHQEDIQDGAEEAVVQFLERSKNDRLRKPSLKEVA